MNVLDDRGRIAGRFNIVDVFAAVVLFLLIPLAIGAYVLFRTPPPALTSVTPKTLFEGPNQRLEIDGANLRPFMRISFDAVPANSFLLGSTKYALVDVPALKPGVYDVVLYDYAREVARLPKALTVAAPVRSVTLEVTGSFKAPPDAVLSALKAGMELPSAAHPLATIVSIGPAVPGTVRLRVGGDTITVPADRPDLPATLLIRCATVGSPDGAVRCSVPDPDQPVVVGPDALLTFAMTAGPAVFQITGARAPQSAVTNRK
jgi:hypothetical protein